MLTQRPICKHKSSDAGHLVDTSPLIGLTQCIQAQCTTDWPLTVNNLWLWTVYHLETFLIVGHSCDRHLQNISLTMTVSCIANASNGEIEAIKMAKFWITMYLLNCLHACIFHSLNGPTLVMFIVRSLGYEWNRSMFYPPLHSLIYQLFNNISNTFFFSPTSD